MQVVTNLGYARRMSIFFAAFFFPFGIYMPYFSAWLKDLGMSAEEIGIILTIPLIMRVAFTPLMAAFADKIGDRRLTLRLYCALYAGSFGLIMLDDSFIWVACIIAISNLTHSAIVPVTDSLAMAGVRRFDLDYGRMRLWGSAAFMVANLVGGLTIDAIGSNGTIWLLVATNGLQILLSFTLPADPRLADRKKLTNPPRLDWQQFKQFGQIGFWLVLAIASLLQASHSLLYGFGTIYWQQRDIPSEIIGLFWATSVVAEILLFIYSKRIALSLNWYRLFIIGAIGASLRWLLFPLDMGIAGYLALQCLHAASFGATHLATMFFLSEMVDDDLSGTAQGLYTMASGLFMAIATLISGALFANLGGQAYFFMTIISLFALMLLATIRFFSLTQISASETKQNL